jgi:hypothetical protein
MLYLMFAKCIVQAVFINLFDILFYQKYSCQVKYPAGYPAFQLAGYPEGQISGKNSIRCIPSNKHMLKFFFFNVDVSEYYQKLSWFVF